MNIASFAAAIVSVALALPLFGAEAVPSEVVLLDRAFDAAILGGDVAFLESICAPTFQFTHGGGMVQRRDHFIAGVATGLTRAISRTTSDQELEMHGDIAIVIGQVRVIRDLPDAKRRDYTIWYERVYRCTTEGWRILSHRTARSTLE
jgi:ketosteroid isomerase-like protein